MKDKRQHILDTAADLFVREGLNVPTARIAKEAGVANGTLFNYFPTKQELQDTLYLESKAELACLMPEKCEGSLEALFRGLWTNYLRWAVNNPRQHQVVHLLKASRGVSSECLAQMENGFQPILDALHQGMREGSMLPLEDDHFEAVLGALSQVTIDQASRKQLSGEAVEAAIAQGFGMFWRAVTSPP